MNSLLTALLLAQTDLRHSFVSLLLAERATVVDVARQAGHSPTVALSPYAHLFEELEGTERPSAEDEIRRARNASRSSRTRLVPTGPHGRTGSTTPPSSRPTSATRHGRSPASSISSRTASPTTTIPSLQGRPRGFSAAFARAASIASSTRDRSGARSCRSRSRVGGPRLDRLPHPGRVPQPARRRWVRSHGRGRAAPRFRRRSQSEARHARVATVNQAG
jgi:hypothetical protein